jgi:hypothetical protein
MLPRIRTSPNAGREPQTRLAASRPARPQVIAAAEADGAVMVERPEAP